jgi:hypothetical protein
MGSAVALPRRPVRIQEEGAPSPPLMTGSSSSAVVARNRASGVTVQISIQVGGRLADAPMVSARYQAFSYSPGWTRTNNPPVNSRMLCQLSYRGTALGRDGL